MHTRADPQPDAASKVDADGRLMFRNTMQIAPGHLAEFKKAIEVAVGFAEQHAPQIMVDVFIDDDGRTATSYLKLDGSQSEAARR